MNGRFRMLVDSVCRFSDVGWFGVSFSGCWSIWWVVSWMLVDLVGRFWAIYCEMGRFVNVGEVGGRFFGQYIARCVSFPGCWLIRLVFFGRYIARWSFSKCW